MDDAILSRQLREYYTSFNATGNLYSGWAKQHGLSYHTLFTLYAIYYGGGSCTQKQICEEWLIPKQTVSSILKALERRGYVRCEVQPEDRRNKNILLTPAGAAYAKTVLEELDKMEKRVARRLGKNTMQQIVDCNKAFYEELRKEIPEEKA